MRGCDTPQECVEWFRGRTTHGSPSLEGSYLRTSSKARVPPSCRSGPSVHDSEAWPVQPVRHGSPARFPSRTVEGPDAQIRIRLPAGSHTCYTAATGVVAMPSPYPPAAEACIGGVSLAANRSRSDSFDSLAGTVAPSGGGTNPGRVRSGRPQVRGGGRPSGPFAEWCSSGERGRRPVGPRSTRTRGQWARSRDKRPVRPSRLVRVCPHVSPFRP